MGLRIMLQPLWFRMLAYGIPFALIMGPHYSFQSPHRPVSGLVWGLASGALFGFFMAYQGKPMHAAMTEAIAGLDDSGRAQAIAAVNAGSIPAEASVRNAAWRLGTAYLGNKSETQLRRREWQSWLVLALLAAGVVWLTTVSTSTSEVAFAIALGAVCVIVMPLQMLRSRRIRRHVQQLSPGSAVPQ